MKTLYTFFMICDARDPNVFHIEMTSMKDYRLRYSAMKSAFLRYIRGDCESSYRDYFDVFGPGYAVYYRLGLPMYLTKENATEYRSKLIENHLNKYRDFQPTYSSGRVTFY